MSEVGTGAGVNRRASRTGSPTLVDVAQEAGVSVSIACRVLRDGDSPVDADLKERVRAAAQRLGYVPNMMARALRGRAPALVGIVAGNMLDPYYGEIAEAVTLHAEATPMMLAMVCNMQRDPVLELKYCRQLWEDRVAGLILMSRLAENLRPVQCQPRESKRPKPSASHPMPFDLNRCHTML